MSMPYVNMAGWRVGKSFSKEEISFLRPELAQKMEEIRSFLRGLGDRQTIRIPLTAMNKKFFLKDGQTWDALFKVISWSCHSLLSGVFPSHRTKLWNNADSPIFEAPFVDIHTFCIDWLHCCDLGVCQDYLGNAMWLIATKLPGDTMDQRTRALFDDIRQYYAASRCENQLSTLTPLMLRKAASKAPKLRSKAGEARSLVDWVVAACDKYLQGSYGLSSEEYACRLASKHLQACYRNLPAESFDADDLAFHCKQFLHLCHGGILC
ncbi:unnamed protein product [Symbiodinium necroappetens]|uniref:Uncharacterized protein n=1 Tax=Symbiodinium necroappetens TaxID=1628268 RepID=A0A812Y543_9DINO|nr:unnamed protein product [Symbiodinium necroappetens]